MDTRSQEALRKKEKELREIIELRAQLTKKKEEELMTKKKSAER